MNKTANHIFEAAKVYAFYALAIKHVLGTEPARNATLLPLSECPDNYQNESCCCCSSARPIGVMQIPVGAEDAFCALVCAECWELRQGAESHA